MLTTLLLKLRTLIGQPYARLDWDAAQILLALDSPTDLQRLFSCKKEPETVLWLTNTLKAGDVFYDIGANVGAYSLIAAHILKDSGNVFAFEPGFANFSTLSKNILKNGLQEHITPIQLALSDANGFTSMHFSTPESGGAKHTLTYGTPLTAGSIAVPTQRLDDFITTYKAPLPTVLKIDVDGGESGVIEGARRTLASASLRALLIEVDYREPETQQMLTFIERVGFTLVEKHPRGKGVSTDVFNLIFSKPH